MATIIKYRKPMKKPRNIGQLEQPRSIKKQEKNKEICSKRVFTEYISGNKL